MVISGIDLLEVPTKKKGLLFRAKFQGISPPFIWPEIWCSISILGPEISINVITLMFSRISVYCVKHWGITYWKLCYI